MIISKIWLRQFRNIKEQMICFDSGLNIFQGSNGQGKTNLIEAIHLLTHGISFRTSDMSFLINKEGFSGFCIESEVLRNNSCNHIKIAVSKGVKSLKIDEKGTTKASLKKSFSSVLFSPEALQIIKDSDKKRRELIDDLCLSIFPDFQDTYSCCQKLLKQKNSLLKRAKEKQAPFREVEELNELLSLQFFKKGSELSVFRLKAIEKILTLLPEKIQGIMKTDKTKIFMEYTVSNEVFGSQERDKLFNAMYKDWRKKKREEIFSGQCLVGPHRHGVKFKFNGQDARFFCSQGQQKAIILAFKMAQMELHREAHGEFPVLLMDDVFSELDGQRQMNFLEEILSIKCQIFLTTVETPFLEKRKSFPVFRVKRGFFNKEEASFRQKELNV